MSAFSLTVEKVKNLLGLIDAGIQHGAGSMEEPGSFCVQQAVSKAILGNRSYQDHPNLCVGEALVSLGINLNDSYSGTEKGRAKALRELAVAELGSNKLDQVEFGTRFQERLRLRRANSVETQAKIAVEILAEMGSEGSKYLYLCRPGVTEPQKKAAVIMARSYAAKLAEPKNKKQFALTS